nr:VOC family protein [Petropleomorpha daqingensis]
MGAITLFTEDLARTAAFYRDVFGLPLLFEDDASAAFRFGGTVINVLRADAAHELIEPAPVGGTDAGRRMQLTVWVADTDAVCAQLAEHGVALLNGPVDRPWEQRTATFTDPGGHVWEVAQTLSPAS